MMVLLTGGSGSGKSDAAERLAMRLEPGRKRYVATMLPGDAESVRRIARHRRMRQGRQFFTTECAHHLEELDVGPEETVLVECLSNLLANEMFCPEGRGNEAVPVILDGIRRLEKSCRNLILVTNDVFGDGVSYGAETGAYVRALGEINRVLAAEADEVWEAVCGLPVSIAGGRPGDPEGFGSLLPEEEKRPGRENAMILITGGQSQGKSRFAAELAESAGRSCRTLPGPAAPREAEGKDLLWDDIHLWVREVLRSGADPAEEMAGILADCPPYIAVIPETGCGLVPVDAFERQFREACGRVGCLLAEHAQTVWRLTCGIPQRLKG